MPSWGPQWAKHVEGSYPEREVDPESGAPEPQLIRMTCSICKGTHQVTCTSGAVRQHIGTFARVHLHREPL